MRFHEKKWTATDWMPMHNEPTWTHLFFRENFHGWSEIQEFSPFPLYGSLYLNYPNNYNTTQLIGAPNPFSGM